METETHQGVGPRPALLAVALAALEQLPRQTRWEAYFRALPQLEQAVLASFALDVAVRRAVRQLEFGILHRLVMAACDQGVVTEAVRQGIRLLDRVRLLDLREAGSTA